MEKISILFGAGAEVSLNMPTGLEFLDMSMPETSEKRKKVITEALRLYYEDVNIYDLKGYSYSSAIISKKEMKEHQEMLWGKRKIEIKDAFINKEYSTNERYFYTLIHPALGSTNFWKIINFYWFAYFTMIEKIYDLAGEKFENIEDYYDYLRNLAENTKKVEQICLSVKKYLKVRDYYDSTLLNEHGLEINGILSTNYTSFINRIGLDETKIAYLAGNLKHFENPYRLDVFDITKKSYDKEVVFPFLMCQSQVKPLIHSYQINEYQKALNVLDDTDTLIVIGYRFNPDDNHINSMIINFGRSGKRLVYCPYSAEDINRFKNGFLKRIEDKYVKNFIILDSTLEKKPSDTYRIISDFFNCK